MLVHVLWRVCAVLCCRAVTAQPDERCTAAVRCAGSALKTRALADQNTEDFRHLIIINASEDHQRRATTRLQLRWARAHVRILGQARHQGEDMPAHQARWWAVRAGSSDGRGPCSYVSVFLVGLSSARLQPNAQRRPKGRQTLRFKRAPWCSSRLRFECRMRG